MNDASLFTVLLCNSMTHVSIQYKTQQLPCRSVFTMHRANTARGKNDTMKQSNGLLLRTVALLTALMLTLLSFSGCFLLEEDETSQDQSQPQSQPQGSAYYNGAQAAARIQPLDLISMADFSPREPAPYTVLILLNGSDLESDGGMATDDLIEMLESGFDEQNVNVVLLTGGTYQWQNDVISEECALYYISDGDLELIAELGSYNIGDPALLAGFINLGYTLFPAQNHGLILWNHGGGSVMGYGVDELFDYDSLTLSELASALLSSQAETERMEFIGFDACLMASLETACVVSPYARYLIASEDLEPGYGWDYTFLRDLSQNPGMNGKELGVIICDYFHDFYELNQPDESTTLSVTNLDRVAEAAQAFDLFARQAGDALAAGEYSTIAKARGRTRSFGDMGAHGGETDMIDVAHLAQQMQELVPDEAQTLQQALANAVEYNVYSQNQQNATGLSVYFPFASKEDAPGYVDVYKGIGVLPDYTNFIIDFTNLLTGSAIASITVGGSAPVQNEDGSYEIVLSPEELADIYEIYFTVWQKEEQVADGVYNYIQLGESSKVSIAPDGTVLTEFDGYWTTLNDYWACLYEIDSSSRGTRYAIPARLNGQDVDLIALYSDTYPDGIILGAVPNTSDTYDMPSRNMLQVKEGDTLALYYYYELFADEGATVPDNLEQTGWYEGEEFIVTGPLVLARYEADDGDYLYGFSVVDTQMNVWYTDFIEVMVYSE